MKKTLLSFMGIAATVFAFGQNTNVAKDNSSVLFQDLNAVKTAAYAPANNNNAAGVTQVEALGQVLFSETFSNGLAGDGNGAWTTNGTSLNTADADAVWEYRGTATTPDNTVGSRGGYNGTRGPILSPTAANGFMIFDSDYLDNNGVAGNFGNGPAATPHESWLVSPTYDLTGSPSVVLNFTTYFRRFQGEGYVLLSIDGGATWGDSVAIFVEDNWGVNVEGDEDAYYNLLVPYIANQANVKIAFYFDGYTAGDGYYFWMLDDFAVAQSADNDLALTGVYYRNTRDTGYTVTYSQIPESQAVLDTMQFSAIVTNNGSVTQENSVFTNDVTSPAGSSSLMSNMNNIASGASDSLIIASTYVVGADGQGTYDFMYEVSSDSTEDVPDDNTDAVSIEVTDSTYARDRNASGNRWYGAGVYYELGPLFDIYDTVKATSVSIGLGDMTPAGSIISIRIYDGSLTTPIVSREFITLAAGDVGGNLATFSIPETILEPGQYIVTFAGFSDSVLFASSPYDADAQTVFVDPDQSGTWFYTTSIPVVRLNVSDDLFVCDLAVTASQNGNNSADANATLGTAPYSYMWDNGETTMTATNLTSGVNHCVTVTDDNGCTASACVDIVSSVGDLGLNSVVTLFPNPNTGNFQINMADVTAGNYKVSVKNYLGQTIYSNAVEVNGAYTGTINLDNVSKGVYFLEVSNENDEKSIIRFVVK